MKDLRVVVFPSECVFALCWLVLQMHAFCKFILKSFFFLLDFITQHNTEVTVLAGRERLHLLSKERDLNDCPMSQQ